MEPTSFCSLEFSQGALHILIFGSQVGFCSLKICRRLEPNAAEYGFEAVLDFEASACAKLARNASISVFSEDSRFTQSDEPLVWVTEPSRINIPDFAVSSGVSFATRLSFSDFTEFAAFCDSKVSSWTVDTRDPSRRRHTSFLRLQPLYLSVQLLILFPEIIDLLLQLHCLTAID